MPKNERQADDIDWSLTTWEGSRREQLRRWAALPLERVILAIEEMQELAEHFRQIRGTDTFSAVRSEPPAASGDLAVHQTPPRYGSNKE